MAYNNPSSKKSNPKFGNAEPQNTTIDAVQAITPFTTEKVDVQITPIISI